MPGTKSKKNKNESKSGSSQEALQYLKDKPGWNDPKVLEEYLKSRR
jgi:hypothetical protein